MIFPMQQDYEIARSPKKFDLEFTFGIFVREQSHLFGLTQSVLP